MTNQEIFQIALRQSAADSNCDPSDFEQSANKIVYSGKRPEARRYLELPFSCDLVSYGNNIVASVSPQVEVAVRQYIGKYPVEHCFETPNLHVLNEALAPYGQKICFMAEYFLPDMGKLHAAECSYEVRILHPADFVGLYRPEWSNALCEDESSWTCWAPGPMTAEGWWGWRPARRTVKPCGRSAWTCCPNTAAGESRRR